MGAGVSVPPDTPPAPSVLVEGVRLGKDSLLVWGLSAPVLYVVRPSREDQGPHNIRLPPAPSPVLFNELVGVRVPTEHLYGLGLRHGGRDLLLDSALGVVPSDSFSHRTTSPRMGA